MLRTHRAGKGPVGCGGWGLSSKNRRGPGVPLTPGLSGRGPHLGAQQASWARVGGANALFSSPAPPVWEGPSHLPLLISPRLPPMPPGPMRPRCGFGWGGTSLGAQQTPWPEQASQLPSAPLPLFPQSPSCLPFLISLTSGAPILSGLHFFSPPQSPYILLVHFGAPPISLGVRVSHQQPAGALVGRCS